MTAIRTVWSLAWKQARLEKVAGRSGLTGHANLGRVQYEARNALFWRGITNRRLNGPVGFLP